MTIEMDVLVEDPVPGTHARPSDLAVDAASDDPICVADEVPRESDVD